MLDIPLFDRFSIRVMTVWSAAAAAMVGAIVGSCQGHFVFALDDPYIHLAVAHNILGGVYGINASEVSSPSSSILWPWLLVVTEALRLGAFGPLALALAASAGSLLVGLRLLRSANVVDVVAAPRWSAGAAIVFVFLVSALSLPFTGLEHSAHIFCSLLTVEALALACAGRAVSAVHLAALAALPLIRFEGLALFLAAIAALAWTGRRREAAMAATAGGLGLALYAAFAWRLGLPWLPSSVLAKSDVTISLGSGVGSFVTAMVEKLAFDLNHHRAAALLTLLGALGWIVWRPAGRQRAPLHLAVAFALAAHLAFGAYGWFSRYEVYAAAVGAFAVLIGLADIFASPGRPLLAGSTAESALPSTPAFAASGLCLVLAGPYAQVTLVTPAAAANIFGQQYQMRRLAQDLYPHPVAVNDIGLVSWGNPNYVLDLWGLGSETARRLRKAGALTPDAMERLADRRGVEMVMIYDHLFAGVPANWRPIAAIDSDNPIVTRPRVIVYLTARGDTAAALGALAKLRATLPAGTRLELTPQLNADLSRRPAG